MRKARFFLAIAFIILGLSATAPRAEAGCFTNYWNAITVCAEYDGYINRDMCGLDAYVDLLGCVRKSVIGA